MSDNSAHHDEAHTGPIKTPKQLLWAALAAFIVPVFIIIGLVYNITTQNKPQAGTADPERGIAMRLQKVGSVALQPAAREPRTGEQVYTAQCAACHATGTMGAPKFGDAAAWAPRLGQGFAGLLNSAMKGKNAMPPQGGGDASELEIGRAVVYMANAAGGKLAEPAAPAGAASAPAAPAAEAPAAPASAAAPVAAAAPAAAVAVVAAPAAAAGGDVGAALYKQTCATCHDAGIAGAPKMGDKAAWAPRIAKGMDALVASSIKGLNAMPPKGGSTASDADLKAAVEHMVKASK